MKYIYGIEAKPLLNEVPEFQKYFEETTKPFTNNNLLYVYPTAEKAFEACELLKEGDMYEDQHRLILVPVGRSGESFEDFGFIKKEGAYLYKDMLIAFYFSAKDKEMIEMASYQIDEHLVYATQFENDHLYFVEQHLYNLVKGIAKAYLLEVLFLDLDK